MASKFCTKCGVSKSLDQFYFEKARARHKTVCKECYPRTQNKRTAEQRAAYRRRRDPSMRAYRTREQIQCDAEAKRRAKAEAAARRLATTAPKRPSVGSKDWYAVASQEEIETYRAAQRNKSARMHQKHLEKRRLKTKLYKRTHREAVSKWGRDRWSRQADAADGTLTPSVIRSLAEHELFCAYCRVELNDDNRTMDHVAPICRGGNHSIDNVVMCCRGCNTSKASRPLLLWLAEREQGLRHAA